jgi:hypothetical protein
LPNNFKTIQQLIGDGDGQPFEVLDMEIKLDEILPIKTENDIKFFIKQPHQEKQSIDEY